MRRRLVVIGAPTAAAALVATGALALTTPWSGGDSSGGDSSGGGKGTDRHVAGGGPPDAHLPDVDTAALVSAVPAEDVAKVAPRRLAAGVVPPSNRWYSGLVFGDQPQPVFARPLSFGLTGSGFTLGLPTPVGSPATIAGPHVPAVTVDVAAASARVSAAGPVLVTIELLDDAGTVLGRVTLAEGSPFVSFTAQRPASVTTKVGASVAGGSFARGEDGGWLADTGTSRWGLVVGAGEDDGADDASGGSFTLAAGRTATWFALPPNAGPEAATALTRAAADPVTGVDVGYGVGSSLVRTTLTYRTAGGAPTAFVTMPHHRTGEQPERPGCGLGAYPSVYGDLELCAGSQLTSFAPVVPATRVLELDGVPADQRSVIRAALDKDVAATPDFPSDSYFGAKALYRAASLVVLGEQLGAADRVRQLRDRTVAALTEWAQPDGCLRRDARCVVYDRDARSVIGRTPSFGSDELNDHHFHYGYLLSAAGLLAQDEPALADRWGPVMDLLGQDIAAARPSEQLPQLRAFDPYAGHSWASGTAPFADGNNQESSSEAVNAWNGLGLWAQASGQTALATQASWLASTEAATARAYWTAPDLTPFAEFRHTMVSLNWGGKRDYATWFSPDPNAILGIQLIPMGPVQTYLAAGVPAQRIRESVREATPKGYGVAFGNYLLMYRALAGPDDAAQAWQEAEDLPDPAIDDGGSRAAMLAFIASVAHG